MSVRQASSDGGIWWHLQTRDIDPSSIQLLHHLCCFQICGVHFMSVICICIIRETYNSNSQVSGFAKTYFNRWSQERTDKRQNACRAWGWLILGRYRRLVGRRSRRQSPSAERGTGHRPLVQHHQSLGKELFAKHLVKITISGSRCLSCRGSCEAS